MGLDLSPELAAARKGVLAQIAGSSAYTHALGQAMRWANTRRLTVGLFVNQRRLKDCGVSRRVFRVERDDRLQFDDNWLLLQRVNPVPVTTRGLIQGVHATESRKRAAPWEGRGRQD